MEPAAARTWDEARDDVEGEWSISFRQPEELQIQEQAELQALLQPLAPTNDSLGAYMAIPEGPLRQSPPAASLLPEGPACLQKEDATATWPLDSACCALSTSDVSSDDLDSSEEDEDIPDDPSVEELHVRFCTTDLLMSAPHRKRPRLLPPHLKMHIYLPPSAVVAPATEARQQGSDLESKVPPEYMQAVDNLSPLQSTDLLHVEKLYRGLTAWHKLKRQPALSQAESQQLIITPSVGLEEGKPQPNPPECAPSSSSHQPAAPPSRARALPCANLPLKKRLAAMMAAVPESV